MIFSIHCPFVLKSVLKTPAILINQFSFEEPIPKEICYKTYLKINWIAKTLLILRRNLIHFWFTN